MYKHLLEKCFFEEIGVKTEKIKKESEGGK